MPDSITEASAAESTDGNEMIFKDKSFVVKEEKAFVEIYDPTWDCHIFLIKK